MSKEPPKDKTGRRLDRRGRDPYNTSDTHTGLRRRAHSGPIELFRKANEPGKPDAAGDGEKRVKLKVGDDSAEKKRDEGFDPYNTTRTHGIKFP